MHLGPSWLYLQTTFCWVWIESISSQVTAQRKHLIAQMLIFDGPGRHDDDSYSVPTLSQSFLSWNPSGERALNRKERLKRVKTENLASEKLDTRPEEISFLSWFNLSKDSRYSRYFTARKQLKKRITHSKDYSFVTHFINNTNSCPVSLTCSTILPYPL